MTIDDELLLELFKPDYHGNMNKDALIIHIVGTRLFDYKLEETVRQVHYPEHPEIEEKYPKMTPDIIVAFKQEPATIAIELENDIEWDFQDSMRQLKKYRQIFGDTRIIIPRDYKRFAPLYCHESFRVYLWSTKRRWKCLRCKHVNVNESRIPPKKCENKEGKGCENKSPNEFDLVGLEDTKVEEYKPEDVV